MTDLLKLQKAYAMSFVGESVRLEHELLEIVLYVGDCSQAFGFSELHRSTSERGES